MGLERFVEAGRLRHLAAHLDVPGEARFAELQELLAHHAPGIERFRSGLKEWFQIRREARGIQTRNRVERESGALAPVLGRRFRHGSLLFRRSNDDWGCSPRPLPWLKATWW